MAPLRSVTDLLAEQSEETLLRMKENNRAELARLTVEGQQIDEALTKKSRRERASGRGGGVLSKEKVFEVVERLDGPATATEVHSLIVNGLGVDVSLNAVRNHLNRLVGKWGWLTRLEDGRFAVVPPQLGGRIPESTSDDDIPF